MVLLVIVSYTLLAVYAQYIYNFNVNTIEFYENYFNLILKILCIELLHYSKKKT
jgi:hypothetical protein